LFIEQKIKNKQFNNTLLSDEVSGVKA